MSKRASAIGIFTVAIAGVFIGCSGINNQNISDTSGRSSFQTPAPTIIVKTEAEQTKEAYADLHDILNEDICFDKLQSYIAGNREDSKKIFDLLDLLTSKAKDNNVKVNLRAAKRLYEYGLEDNDEMALKWSHRIIHELDYFIINPECPHDLTQLQHVRVCLHIK